MNIFSPSFYKQQVSALNMPSGEVTMKNVNHLNLSFKYTGTIIPYTLFVISGNLFFSFFFCIDSYTLDDLWAFLRAHNTIGKTSRTYYSFSDPFLKTEALVILPLTLKCASQLKGRPGRVSKKLRDTERKHSNGKLRSLRGEEAYTHISIRNILS